MPYVRCAACSLRFHAAASHATRVRCPACDTVLSAVELDDVNAWLARRIVAEMPTRRTVSADKRTASEAVHADG